MPHSPRWLSLTLEVRQRLVKADRVSVHQRVCGGLVDDVAYALSLLGDKEAKAAHAAVKNAERALLEAKKTADAFVLRKFEGDLRTAHDEIRAEREASRTTGLAHATSTSAPTKAPALPPHLKTPLFARPGG